MLGGSGIYLKANASPQRVLGKRAARFRKISATSERRRDWKEAMTAITATPKATSLVCCGGDQERRPYGKKTELGFLGHSSEPVLLNYKFLHHQAIAPRQTPHQKQSLPLPTHHPEGGVPGSQRSSKCGLQSTNSINITWEWVGNANSWPILNPVTQNLCKWGPAMCFNKPSR